ncbi:Flavin-containing monooxygenase FMO [Macrophomina phaseolina MS6]|uniref:Flavin-containing monooxygenase FMO n=1 Tax=Macrophomina phaseolina (strain MS6) TaxID=1126212 RepID=K2SFQ3_MACPH|nr:Flavin-containing monooxygenase FMO [Macrophomina phaseolina MS6]
MLVGSDMQPVNEAIMGAWELNAYVGGCCTDIVPHRIGDKNAPPNLQDLPALASRSADLPLEPPAKLPAQTPKSSRPRFTESSIYPYLETNVAALPMSFSQEPIPETQSEWSIKTHGPDTPFRHWTVMQQYISSLIQRRGYQDYVEYNTAVERVEKVENEWKITLRKQGEKSDYWWAEFFDAVVVASGHHNVPYIPKIQGLEEFERRKPGSVLHSKMFRGREAFRGKRVVVVGASVSAADIGVDVVAVAKNPVYAVVKGHRANIYFGDTAFKHPKIKEVPSISEIRVENGSRAVYFEDGDRVEDVDHIIFGTGYTWSLPFLPNVEIRNNRVAGLYQHVVYQKDPTLLFVGAVGAGLTFKIFEWQAVLAARVLAGRAKLPPVGEQQRWEADRIAEKGDGARFTLVFPEFEEYFETVRALAGPGEDGKGRQLPPFDRRWFDAFMEGHERRKAMWARWNAEAKREEGLERARL